MKTGVLIFILVLLAFMRAGAQSLPVGAGSNEAAAPVHLARPVGRDAASSLPPEKKNPIRLPRFQKAPVIDGKLDDEIWASAVKLGAFYQIRPGDNLDPSKQTEVLLGYDARHLYLAFVAHDDAGKVRATVAKRDEIDDDDNVSVILDTFNDKRKGYVIGFNPLGVQADGIYLENGGFDDEDLSFDLVMESKGTVNDKGYVVEVAIPFKSLRYEAGKGKLWGLHFFRVIQRFNNEESSWMPISRDNSSRLAQSGYLTGLEEIDTERTLEFIPTLALSESGSRVSALPAGAPPGLFNAGRFVNRPPTIDPGLTVRFGLTPTITLDAAFNPDFAQVEADATVITANQRFPIFFEEKRPFFLEGIDIFQTPLRAVHTRAIVDPDVAVKLSGRRGKYSFGVMLASDRAPGSYSEDERNDPDTRPAIEKFLDKNASIGVVRIKRDVGKQSSLGLIATSYNFIEKHNQLGGLDGRFRINAKTNFNFQVLGTTSRRNFYDPDQDKEIYRTGNGFGYTWTWDYTGRRIGYFLTGEGLTRDYRADVGFTRRTNTNFNGAFFRFGPEPNPKTILTQWRSFSRLIVNYDWQGRLQSFNSGMNAFLSFKRQTRLGGGFFTGYERVFEEEFGARRTRTRPGAFFGSDSERSARKQGFFAFFETNPTKKYQANLGMEYVRGELDFDGGAGPRFPRVSRVALADPAALLDPGPGNLRDIFAGFTWQPTSALRSSLNYTSSRLIRHDTSRVAFADNILSWQTTYQFTRFLFARTRVDYSTLSAQVRGQYLFGWTPNPGTSIYAGYNNNLNYQGYSPFTELREPGFRRNGQTFFIKFSYLIRRSL